MSLLLRNGRVITAERDEIADVFIAHDRVTDIGPSLKGAGAEVIDASGLFVIPGGVDPHTHMEAPVGGTLSSDDFETGTRAAAWGGTTTVIDFATQARGVSLRTTLDLWQEKARKSTIDYALHMIVVDLPPDPRPALEEMVAYGVTSFKVFTAYPGVLMSDDALILRLLEESRALGALVCVHAENGTVIADLVRRALARGQTAPFYHARTRPPEAEAEATHRALRLAEMAGAPVYIVHVTCRQALGEIRDARARGVRALGETCPQYLLLTEEELARPGMEGAKFVLTPPLRSRPDGESLWQALEEGDLQAVSTDHCPFMYDGQKLADTRDFTRIPNGGPGVEHRLQLTYHYGVLGRGMTLRRWVEINSASPARIFGLYPRKGTIRVGSDADIVLWNPGARSTISCATHHMQVDYSLFEGWTVTGNADIVIARGEVLIRDGRWLGRRGRGRYLHRSPDGGASASPTGP
ncbi:MAG: dihydropyrimidinase [Bacteroidota bacterium]